MDFFVLKVCGYNKATIKFAAAVFISGIQQHRHEFYNETIVLVKETL